MEENVAFRDGSALAWAVVWCHRAKSRTYYFLATRKRFFLLFFYFWGNLLCGMVTIALETTGESLATLPCYEAMFHYNDVIMGAMASQMTSLAIVYSTVYSDADQRKHQSSVSLAFVWGIRRWPVNSPHKWPVTRKFFTFVDVIMLQCFITWQFCKTHTSSFCCNHNSVNVISAVKLYGV